VWGRYASSSFSKTNRQISVPGKKKILDAKEPEGKNPTGKRGVFFPKELGFGPVKFLRTRFLDKRENPLYYPQTRQKGRGLKL